MNIANLITIFFTACIGNNIVLMRFIALCPFIGMSTDVDKSVGMGVAVIFVTFMATFVTYPIYKYILVPLNVGFLQLLVFILVIASLVQLVEFFLKKVVPSLYTAMGVYLALITTNCAILAVTIDVVDKGYTFVEALVYALGVSVGFLIAMLLLAGLRKKLAVAPIPEFLQGTPILFIVSGLLSLCFIGLGGIF